MARSRVLGLSFSILSILVLCTFTFAQAPLVITQRVDESKLVTLSGNTRPEATQKNDRGLVPDNLPLEHVMLQLKRSSQQEQALQQYIDGLQNPHSQNYHRWLTAKQFGKRYGLATQDLNVITNWLQSQGFAVNGVYENAILIDFSGTAGQVRQAFHTEIHQLEVNGTKHIANMSNPRIPAALSPAVVGVVSLHDFKPHAMYKPRPNYTFSSGGYTYWAVVPGDLAKIYNLNPLFNAGISGQGQTIAVVEDTDLYSNADWTTFRSTFGLSSYSGSLTTIHPSGTTTCSDPGVDPYGLGYDGEAILDAEYASAAAPSAAIQVASCADTQTTFGGLIAIQNLVNGNSPPAIMSMSYGECEAFNGASSNASYNSAFQQAVAEGVSVFVSSDDEGAAGCSADSGEASDTYGIGVNAFASTPYNIAVGGTDFGDYYAGTTSTYWSSTNSSTYASALSYVPEIPWNDSCAGQLGALYSGYSQTYGSSGYCNSQEGEQYYLDTTAGGGGPSGCATGSPSQSGVVGGSCAGYSKPSWQSLVGVPNDGVRDLPDVSLFAGNGVWGHYYVFCWSDPAFDGNGAAACTGAPDNWSGAGGTSFASPIMAGIQALVNQNAGGRQGNPNPIYYTLAATEYGASGDASCNSTLGNATSSSCIFYDVTLGDMDVNCLGTYDCYLPSGTNGVLSTSDSAYDPAYGTQTGWDFATGIGTVNAYNLVNNWNVLPAAATTVASSENPAYSGASVTFTATVAETGNEAPTGTATFNDGGTALGSPVTLSASQATFTTSTLAVGTHSITAVYSGDQYNAGSTSAPLSQVIEVAPTFTFTNTGSASHTVLAGETTLTYTFLATPTSASTFTNAVTFGCAFSPKDPTLTGSSCVFSPSSIAAGTSSPSGTPVTMTITTTGPNSGTGTELRHRADKRSPWLPLTLPIVGVVMLGLMRGKVGRRVSKRSAIALLCFSLVLLGFMAACGGSSTTTPVSVTVTPSSTVQLYADEAGNSWPTSATQQQFSATVNNATSQTVTWAVTGGSANGTITSAGLYTSPATVPSPATVTVTATSALATTPGSGKVDILIPTGDGLLPATYAVTATATENGATPQSQVVSLIVK